MIQKRDCLKICKKNYHKDTQNPQLSHDTPSKHNDGEVIIIPDRGNIV